MHIWVDMLIFTRSSSDSYESFEKEYIAERNSADERYFFFFFQCNGQITGERIFDKSDAFTFFRLSEINLSRCFTFICQIYLRLACNYLPIYDILSLNVFEC